jgi:galactokinase
MGFALNELYGLNLSRLDLALTAQRAEHHFAGLNCGIMDMYASLFGKKDSVIKLDCRSLLSDYFPFHAPDHQLILCNSGVKHSLGDSEYNTRRSECEAGVAILQTFRPDIKNLRDVSLELLQKHQVEMPPVVYQRCKYVAEEIGRVGEACDALAVGDLTRFGQLMYATHDGLQYDYEVSCEELDFLVDTTRTNASVLGSRMMGGGFGGCTLNLVKRIDSQSFIGRMKEAYHRKYGLELACYEVELTNGVEKIETA